MNKKAYRIWMVRAGSGSFLIDEFLQQGIVAIGWRDLGRIDQNTSYQELKSTLVALYPDWSISKIGQSAGQIWRFFSEFKKGDKVVTYDSNARTYCMGVIQSEYHFNPEFQYPHYRKVSWEEFPVGRDYLKVESKNTLGSILTIFELSREIWTELEELQHPSMLSELAVREMEEEMERQEAQELEQLKKDAVFRSLEFIKDIISGLDWEEVERVIAGLMRAMGYKTRMTKRGSDLGSDIIASPDGLAMVEPIIKIEVKHRIKSKDKISAPDLRNFIGGLRAPTKGIYVSTTGFSNEARYEAERATFPITLIDFDSLVELLIEYYETLDVETKSLVPLQKIYWPV